MEIAHAVHPTRQPNLNDCWAAAAAMVLRLHGPDGVSEVKRRVSGVTLNANGSLPPNSVPALGRALRLRVTNLATPQQPLTVAVLTTALRNSCAAAFGEFYIPSAQTSTQHVLLFYRLSGSATNPMAYLIEPYTAGRINYYFDEFNEGVGSVDYLLYQ